MRKEPQFDLNRVTYMSMRYAPQHFKKIEVQRESRLFREKIKKDLENYSISCKQKSYLHTN